MCSSQVAMKQQYGLIIKNGTWEFKDLSLGKNIVTNKWVFKKKLVDGNIEKLHAQLVATGFEQVQGIDLQETFAPIFKWVTIKIVIAMAFRRGWAIKQLYV